jgi:hypothetical protein
VGIDQRFGLTEPCGCVFHQAWDGLPLEIPARIDEDGHRCQVSRASWKSVVPDRGGGHRSRPRPPPQPTAAATSLSVIDAV